MRRILTISIGVLLLAGCGSKKGGGGTVTGTITYQGKPVNGALLILFDAEGSKQEEETPTIPVTQEGTFSSSDIPPGNYKVVVQPADTTGMPSTKGMSPAKVAEVKDKLDKLKITPTIRFPEKYKLRQTTTLTMTVAPGEQSVNLQLN